MMMVWHAARLKNSFINYVEDQKKWAHNTVDSGNSKLGFVTNFVYNSACSLCYKTIPQFHQKCFLIRDCLLFRRLLLPESTVLEEKQNHYITTQ